MDVDVDGFAALLAARLWYGGPDDVVLACEPISLAGPGGLLEPERRYPGCPGAR